MRGNDGLDRDRHESVLVGTKVRGYWECRDMVFCIGDDCSTHGGIF